VPSTIISDCVVELRGIIRWEAFEYAIVESADCVRLLTLANECPVPETYDSGILFGTEAELRWRRRRSGLFHVVLIRDGATDGVELEAVGEQQFVLWGEPEAGSDPPAWYEPRIPRMITEYPSDLKGKRVAVSVKSYRLRVDVPQPCAERREERIVTLLRCVSLVEARLED
jgi:hypothetical protein